MASSSQQIMTCVKDIDCSRCSSLTRDAIA